MKWKDAIPEIRERIRIEKDPDVRAEGKNTIAAIEIYHERAAGADSSRSKTEERMYMYEELTETKCKVIPVRKVIRKRGHHHLRPKRHI